MLEAVESLKMLGLPVAPVGLRARAVYQQAVAGGLTAQEAQPASAAAREVALLWEHVDASLFSSGPAARRTGTQPRRQPIPAAMATERGISAAE